MADMKKDMSRIMSVVFHAGEERDAEQGICRALDDGGEIAPDFVEESLKGLARLRKPRCQGLELL
jgi:hypothetical protein